MVVVKHDGGGVFFERVANDVARRDGGVVDRADVDLALAEDAMPRIEKCGAETLLHVMRAGGDERSAECVSIVRRLSLRFMRRETSRDFERGDHTGGFGGSDT